MSKFIEHKEHQGISWKLPTAMILIIATIILAFMFRQTPKYSYKLSVPEMHKKLMKPRDNSITMKQVASIIFTSEPGYQFVDLRSPQEFIKGHIPGAVNIPVHRLLDPEFTPIWADTATIHILYSDKHSRACAPWMLLQQMGYSSSRIMIGGYAMVKDNILDRNNVMSVNASDEEARYDFAKIVAQTSGGASGAAPAAAPAAVAPKAKKSKAVSGGC
jgi:3-mercaptopyruvate sulfurtransferase SseA